MCARHSRASRAARTACLLQRFTSEHTTQQSPGLIMCKAGKTAQIIDQPTADFKCQGLYHCQQGHAHLRTFLFLHLSAALMPFMVADHSLGQGLAASLACYSLASSTILCTQHAWYATDASGPKVPVLEVCLLLLQAVQCGQWDAH